MSLSILRNPKALKMQPMTVLILSQITVNKKNEPLGNRLYRYELVNNKLLNQKLLLDLPARPGLTYNGGVVLIGPDDNIYTVIGDLTQRNRSLAQNVENSKDPDGRGGILRITQDGEPWETAF